MPILVAAKFRVTPETVYTWLQSDTNIEFGTND